ncbi:MAG: RNA methyltransferase [Leadbetterella sp.]
MEKLSMSELGRLSPEEFKITDKRNVIIILDDVRSMANVGSIFRTSDGFLVKKIYLCGITSVPPHREIEKTALGATESVEWEYIENVNALVDDLKSRNVKICALEQVKGSISLTQFRPDENQEYAFIFGNEVFGVKQSLIDNCDVVLEIPQFGTKHSFNVSVTTAIVLWDYYSKITENTRL